jgi:hypothetical protein
MSLDDANPPDLNTFRNPDAFAAEVRAFVLANAPSRFAIVGELAEDDDCEPDAYIAAWGLLELDGTVHVTGCGERRHVAASSVERAALLISRLIGAPTRVEWLDPVPEAA